MRKIAAILWCALALPTLQAEERFFVVLFASSGNDGDPRRAHTFATFLKVDIGEPDEDGEIPTEAMETATISWLPANGEIRLLALPESGRNFDLQESIRWAKDQGMRTSVRGPFEISEKVYSRALKQKKWLESGAVAYKALDRLFRSGSAVNCIHAVSDVIPGPLLFTGSARGDAATDLVAEHFRPLLPDPDRVHAWVMRHLELDGERVAVRNDAGAHVVETPVFAE